MARIIGVVNGNSHERNSPSEIFSTNILQMEKKKENKSILFKKLAIFAAILCILFMLATIALAITLGMKMRSFQDIDDNIPDIVPSPLLEKAQVIPTSGKNKNGDCTIQSSWPKPSGSLHAKYKRAAIATDHGYCSEIGRNVLFRGGNAVEASIASLLCIGVLNPQSSGLGGGFIMTIFNSTTQRCLIIDARETAPSGTTEDMFVNTPSTSNNGSVFGYRSIATPGELHGYYTAFTKHGSGRVTWESLFTPAIELAKNGFPVSSNLAMVLQKMEHKIREDEDMRSVFFDPRTNKPYEEGDIMTRHRLAETLSELATSSDPVKLFYKGGMAQTISAEIMEKGGLVSLEDLNKYETTVHDTPLESESLPGDLIVCGPPPPSSFAATQAIINVMAELYKNETIMDLNDPLIYHRLIEAEKFAYAERTKLGDIKFIKEAADLAVNMTHPAYAKWIIKMIKEQAQPANYYSRDMKEQAPDHGTSHVSALDHEGNAVSVTSTVNQLLGSTRISPTLGILWNDQMDDFSTPGQPNLFGFAPSEANFIAPGKKPMSSMSPLLIYDKKEMKVKMVIGASGGSRIISAVAQVVVRALIFNQTVKEAVDAPRIHNQFAPFLTEYESKVPNSIIASLTNTYKQEGLNPVEKQPSVVQALIHEEDGFIHGNSDFRRQTSTYPAGY